MQATVAQLVTQPITVFLVAKGTNAVPLANEHLFDANGAANRIYNRIVLTSGLFLGSAGSQVTIPDSQSTAPHILTTVCNGASGSFEVSGFPKVDADLGSSDWNFATLFANTPITSTAVAWVAEFIIYDRVLDPDEIDLIQSYLENRWL